MKVKVILSIVALFSSLGVGGSLNVAWGFLEQLQQNDMRHDNNIQILTEETVMLKYNVHEERLANEIRGYKNDLFELRKEYGGTTGDETLPLGDDRIRMWYRDIKDKLAQSIKALEELKKEMDKFQDPLKDIRKKDAQYAAWQVNEIREYILAFQKQ